MIGQTYVKQIKHSTVLQTRISIFVSFFSRFSVKQAVNELLKVINIQNILQV